MNAPTFQPGVDYAKTDRAVGALTTADVSFTLQSGTITINGAAPSSKVWLALDPTSATAYEPVYATVNGTSVTGMYRPSPKNHPLVSGVGCEVRLINSADMINNLNLFMESGWTPVPTNNITVAFVSATSFTVTGDWTTILSKGDKIRLTNVTTKYGYVVSTSVASAITTVTLATNTDYVLVSGAITAVSYSKLSSPSGHPIWLNWTYNPQGFSVVPTFGAARFKVDNQSCTYYIYESADGTSNSVNKTYSLPITCTATGATLLSPLVTTMKDNGVRQFGKHVIGSGTPTVTCYPSATAATWTASGASHIAGEGVVITYPI